MKAWHSGVSRAIISLGSRAGSFLASGGSQQALPCFVCLHMVSPLCVCVQISSRIFVLTWLYPQRSPLSLYTKNKVIFISTRMSIFSLFLHGTQFTTNTMKPFLFLPVVPRKTYEQISSVITVYAVSTPDALHCRHSDTLCRYIFLQMLSLILEDVCIPFSTGSLH